jgi:protein tyrosine/serine phosphatase
MLTLMLVIGLCSDVGCDYIDATKNFVMETDADCFQMAEFLNDSNRASGEQPRFACLEPAKYLALAKKEI